MQRDVRCSSYSYFYKQPPCTQCLAARKMCVWFPDRAQCHSCHSIKKCDFGDTFKWLKACSWLSDQDPKELRRIVESKQVKVIQSRTGLAYSPSPFWYEQRNLVTTSMGSSIAGPSSHSKSSSYSLPPFKAKNYDDLYYQP